MYKCACDSKKQFGQNITTHSVVARSQRALEEFKRMIEQSRTFDVRMTTPVKMPSSNALSFTVEMTSGEAHNKGNHWHDADRKMSRASEGLQVTWERSDYRHRPLTCPNVVVASSRFAPASF